MGRINALISDSLESKLRAKAAQKYLGKKGSLGLALSEAIELWLKEEDRKEKSK
jgi:predicted alternative tryptophan synthase beta-subunit